MKHKQVGRKLSRVRKQRKALIKTLLGSLVMNEKISTTEAKAKEIKPLVDKLVNRAKKSKNGSDRKVTIIRDLRNKIPQRAVEKIISSDFLGKLESRNSGYTRIIKMPRRKSDSAKIAVIEFV